MTAPPELRGNLFVLYAFNLEVARAPWVSAEPMIAEMRLQFWRDVLDEISEGKQARAHEVAEPLSVLVRDRDLPVDLMHKMIDARLWDIGRDPFDSEDAFATHINETSGNLMKLSVRCLGPEADDVAANIGYAAGIANWFVAIPALEAANRVPLVDGRPDAIRNLAKEAMARLIAAKSVTLPKHALPALRSGWLTGAILKTAISDPKRVASGSLYPSEFRRRMSLMLKSMVGRA